MKNIKIMRLIIAAWVVFALPAFAQEATKETAQAPYSSTAVKPSLDELIYRTNLGRAADVALLISQGADVNASNENGVPLLALAASRADAEAVNILKTLVEAGADVNKTDKRGQNALFYAAKIGNKDSAEYLLSKNIRYAVFDNDGNNVRNFAHQAGHDDIVNAIDNFIAKRKEEVKKEYEETTKQIQESYIANQSVWRSPDSAPKKPDATEIKDKPATEVKKPEQISVSSEQMRQLISDLAFSSCAMAYWQYADTAHLPTELNAKDLQLNISKQKERIIKLSNAFVGDFSGKLEVAQKIVNVSTAQINNQLAAIPSNDEWKKKGGGTINDMNSRCRTIANIWTAVSN